MLGLLCPYHIDLIVNNGYENNWLYELVHMDKLRLFWELSSEPKTEEVSRTSEKLPIELRHNLCYSLRFIWMIKWWKME